MKLRDRMQCVGHQGVQALEHTDTEEFKYWDSYTRTNSQDINRYWDKQVIREQKGRDL